jgi:hypothetical protein
MPTPRLTTQLAALQTLIANRWPNRIEHQLVTQLATTLPRSLDHLTTITADGHPTTTPGAADHHNGGRTDNELTTVEAAVEARLQLAHPDRSPTDAYHHLCTTITTAATFVALNDRPGVRNSLRAAQRIVDTWQPPATPTYTQLRCTPPADEATQPWTRPDCENIAAPGRRGLCDACSMRRHRWRKQHHAA